MCRRETKRVWLWTTLCGAALLAPRGATTVHAQGTDDVGRGGPPHGPSVRQSYVETVELVALAARHAAGLGENGLPPGWFLIEGDIQVPPDFFERGSYDTNLWADGVVPYEFDQNTSTPQRQVALDAMQDWADVSALDFRPREQFDFYFLHFRDANENSSPVGPQFNGNTINIADWDEFIVAHEVGHSLGYWHEHARPDRNTYVQIVWTNIVPGEEHNFEIHGNAYGPYDFESVMHYDRCEFSCCTENPQDCHVGSNCFDEVCFTVVVREPYHDQWQLLIGQRSYLSDWDERQMLYLYPPGNWRFVDTTYGGVWENGTFIEPYKTVQRGLNETPAGGTLVIMQPTSFDGPAVYNNRIVIQAPLGGVVLR